MIYLTGDTHGDFERIKNFSDRFYTKKTDIMIILGDAGINFSGFLYDQAKKEYLQSLPITILAVHGNHEMRPASIPDYLQKEWRGGIVYYEEKYPDILFAKDGEVYQLNGKRVIAIGGAYSVDKMYRIAYGYGWWPDEQPSEEIKAYVEAQLERMNWNVDVVLSHTVPLKYEPREGFLSGINQKNVDKSTEIWLDSIEDRLQYEKWYAGHFHIEKRIDKLEILFENYEILE